MTRTSGANGGGQQGSGKLPRKRFYRARAHSNPLSDSHFPIPISPDDVDLSQHYPRYFPADKGEHGDGDAEAPRIRFADVGCGFGGLLVGLSPLFPDKLMIGMELRDKVIFMLLLQFGFAALEELMFKGVVIGNKYQQMMKTSIYFVLMSKLAYTQNFYQVVTARSWT